MSSVDRRVPRHENGSSDPTIAHALAALSASETAVAEHEIAVAAAEEHAKRIVPRFDTVLTELRLLYNKNSPLADDPRAAVVGEGVGKAFHLVERECAVQAVISLFGHLMAFEQAVAAITLLAFSLPHAVRNDPRIRSLIKEALTLGWDMRDPLVEQAYNYLGLVHAVHDSDMKLVEFLPNRARYWLSVTRLTRAKTSMEFGTGCGSNTFHAAQLDANIKWIGCDVSEPQIKFLKEQAERLQIPNVIFASMREAEAEGIKVDCVALLDVIEHSAWGDELLDRAEKLVAPGGVVCISVPNGPWSPWSLNRVNTVVGSHVAVESMETLYARIEARGGHVLDARVIPGDPGQGNSNVGLTYEPKAAK